MFSDKKYDVVIDEDGDKVEIRAENDEIKLHILLFVKIATAYMDYRKTGGNLQWGPIAIIFGGLLFSLTAPLYIWTII